MRCACGCACRQCFENYRQCFDKDEVIFGGGQGWMSQQGCGLLARSWRWRKERRRKAAWRGAEIVITFAASWSPLRNKLDVRFAMARRLLFSFSFQRLICAVTFVSCLAGVALPAWAQFETRSSTTLPQGADCIALGDFNNDGKLDLVVTDDNGFTVSLGNGDGTFQSPRFTAPRCLTTWRLVTLTTMAT